MPKLPVILPPKQAPCDCAPLRVLRSGWYILGKEVEQFEEAFVVYTGRKYCVGLNSGLVPLLHCKILICSIDSPYGKAKLLQLRIAHFTIFRSIQAHLKRILRLLYRGKIFRQKSLMNFLRRFVREIFIRKRKTVLHLCLTYVVKSLRNASHRQSL